MTTKTQQPLATLSTSSPLNSVGNVFCMTVDSFHSHENSSGQSVSTLSTVIDQITLLDKLSKQKHKIINKPKTNVAYWSKQQIQVLIKLMKKYGSDFTMIATQMNKTRDQIKRKFKVLQKKHPHLSNAIFEREVPEKTQNMMTEEPQVQENDFFME